MRVAMIADTVARWLLTLLAFLIPLFVFPVSWAQIPQGKMLLLTLLVPIALLAFLVARVAEGTLSIPRHPILLASTLLPIAYLASALGSHAPVDSFFSGIGTVDTVAAITLFFGVLALGGLLFSGKNSLYPFLALLAGTALVVFFQIARLVVPNWLTLGGAMSGSASSVAGSWHDLGILVALLVFFAVVVTPARDVLPKALRIASALLGALAFGLLSVISFADIWYALGALLLLYGSFSFAVAYMREGDVRKVAIKGMLLPAVLGVVALGMGFYSALLFSYLPSTLQISQLEVRPSWQTTYLIGEKVFSSGEALFGAGPDTFSDIWAKWKPLSVNQTDFWSVDFRAGVGLIPTSFITAGILGSIAWILLVLVLLYRLARLARVSARSPQALQVGLLAGALFLIWFHISYAPGPTISIVLFLLLGLFIAAEKAVLKRMYSLPLAVQSVRGVVGVLAALIIAGGVILSAGAIARASISDLYVAKAAAAYNAGRPLGEAVALVQRALHIYPGNAVAHRAAVQVGLLELQVLISKGAQSDVAQLKAMLDRTVEEGLKAVAIDSSDYQNWLALASLYQNLASSGISGAYDQAVIAYKRAAATSPTNPIPLVNVAQLSMSQGDASSSIAYLNSAITLKPNLAVAYYLRSQAKASIGDFPSGIQDAEAAVSLARQDPLGWYNLGTIFYASGDYADATLALSQAVSLQNNYANALFVLSLALQKQNNYPGAIAAMQRVVELNPDNSMVKDALDSLMTASTTPAVSSTKK